MTALDAELEALHEIISVTAGNLAAPCGAPW